MPLRWGPVSVDREITADDIRAMLAERVEEVINRYMPGAEWQTGRTEWRCGGIHGGPGTSFVVYVKGAKRGTWRDFSRDGRRSSMIDLIQEVTNTDVAGAFREARAFLGISGQVDNARIEAARQKARLAAAEREKLALQQLEEDKERALNLWKSTDPIQGTDAEIYLREFRKVEPFASARYAFLTYWVQDKDQLIDMGRFSCMVTAVANAKRRITTVHLTYLDLIRTGGKVSLTHPRSGRPLPAKKFYTSPLDGWIWLTPPRKNMFVTEGSENGASCLKMVPENSDWGCFAAGSVSQFDVIQFPPLVERVLLVGDGDSKPARDKAGQPLLDATGRPVIPAREASERALANYKKRVPRADAVFPYPDANALMLQGEGSNGI